MLLETFFSEYFLTKFSTFMRLKICPKVRSFDTAVALLRAAMQYDAPAPRKLSEIWDHMMWVYLNSIQVHVSSNVARSWLNLAQHCHWYIRMSPEKNLTTCLIFFFFSSLWCSLNLLLLFLTAVFDEVNIEELFNRVCVPLVYRKGL